MIVSFYCLFHLINKSQSDVAEITDFDTKLLFMVIIFKVIGYKDQISLYKNFSEVFQNFKKEKHIEGIFNVFADLFFLIVFIVADFNSTTANYFLFKILLGLGIFFIVLLIVFIFNKK